MTRQTRLYVLDPLDGRGMQSAFFSHSSASELTRRRVYAQQWAQPSENFDATISPGLSAHMHV
jgi:hypothetical protein